MEPGDVVITGGLTAAVPIEGGDVVVADFDGVEVRLGAYATPIDEMLSLPPQQAILELMPDQGAEPRPDGP